jgi:DNA-binding NarL/FixJ family response regulator
MSRIAVLISDATRIGCELLAGAISRCSQEVEVTDWATSVESVLRSVNKRPDVALISADLEDGALAGFNAVRQLQVKRTPIKVVMIFDSFERDLILGAFRCGVRGVFFRDRPVEDLCKCIVRVHEGQIWAGNQALELLIEAFTSAAPVSMVTRSPSLLSAREEQIVDLVSRGLTNREVSQRLNLSEHTVKNYLFRIFEKLGVTSRVELALYHRNRDNVA